MDSIRNGGPDLVLELLPVVIVVATGAPLADELDEETTFAGFLVTSCGQIVGLLAKLVLLAVDVCELEILTKGGELSTNLIVVAIRVVMAANSEGKVEF